MNIEFLAQMVFIQSEHRILMWKKIEGVSAQPGRTRLKRQKPSQCEIIQQMNSNEIGKDLDRKMIHQVNFRFEPQGINRKDARVHSKQGTRRVGGKVVIQRQKKTGQKENNGPRRIVKVEDNILKENGSQVVLLGVKSCIVEKDEGKTSINNQKHTRYSSNAESCKSQAQDDQSINITPIPTKSTDEIFRQINRRMAEEKQSTRVRKTNQNCLFYNLKRKLQREMMRIEGQSQRNECKLMIEGCEIQKHRRNVHSAASFTERSTPRSALSSARTYSSAEKAKGKLQRPLSCQARSQVDSHEIKMLQTQSRRLLGSKEGKTERSTTREKECQRKYIANNLNTFHNSHSLKPYKSAASKTQKKHAEDNQKLNSILNECFTHEAAFGDVTNKMRTFEYYCKKMSAGMQKASTKLDGLNEMDKFDD